MEGVRPRDRPKKIRREIVETDCQVRGLNSEDVSIFSKDMGKW